MADAHIPDRLRQRVRERAKDKCEYCHAPQAGCSETLPVDHVRPRSEEGKTTFGNLALSCSSCNGSKLGKMTGRDPSTNREVRLFNPRRQKWDDHFKWSDDFTQIIGKTPCGCATVETLKMNRPPAVQMRLFWQAVGLHPPGAKTFRR